MKKPAAHKASGGLQGCNRLAGTMHPNNSLNLRQRQAKFIAKRVPISPTLAAVYAELAFIEKD